MSFCNFREPFKDLHSNYWLIQLDGRALLDCWPGPSLSRQPPRDGWRSPASPAIYSPAPGGDPGGYRIRGRISYNRRQSQGFKSSKKIWLLFFSGGLRIRYSMFRKNVLGYFAPDCQAECFEWQDEDGVNFYGIRTRGNTGDRWLLRRKHQHVRRRAERHWVESSVGNNASFRAEVITHRNGSSYARLHLTSIFCFHRWRDFSDCVFIDFYDFKQL